MPSRSERAAARTAHPFDRIPFLPCRNSDPEVFFPDPGGSGREGKEICDRCDIKTECAAWALQTGQAFGTWGGLTAGERSRLSKSARQAIIRAARPLELLIPNDDDPENP